MTEQDREGPRRLRWGVLGTAGINDKVVPAIQASELGEVTAIASRSLDKARAHARRLAIPTAHDGYESLLADPDIDVVYLPLPNHLHHPWVLRAAAAGKHILCEKPMALTAAQAEEMRAAAAAAGVVLAEGFMYGHHPRYDRVREILMSGEIGPVRSISTAFTFDASDEPGLTAFAGNEGGGALYDVGCYLVHVSRLLLGREPDAVTIAAQWSPAHGDIDMLSAGLLEFGDIPVLIRCGMWAADQDTVEVVGKTGRLLLPSAFFCAEGSSGIEVHVGEQVRTEVIDAPDHYSTQADDLARAVLSGEPLRYPATDPAANLAVLEACLRSAREKRRVEVAR
jgi:predicted dehydrogenase